MNERIRIPDCPAGQLAFDAFHSIARKMFAVGNEATGDFAEANFPGARTIGKGYADRKFRRVVEHGDGARDTIVYDYMTQTTMALAG
jgi:hypothetical protein